MKAWYFSTEERKLRYNDNRSITVGETHSVDGKIELCKNGLHASERLIDALRYAPGRILYKVELSGEMDIGDDKVCAASRTYLQELDATEVLRAFARKQAMINIELIKPYCSEEQYSDIMKYLTEEDLSEEARVACYNAALAAYYAAAFRARYAADAALAAYAAAFRARYAADAALAAHHSTNVDACDATIFTVRATCHISGQSYAEEMNKANEMLTQIVEEAMSKK